MRFSSDLIARIKSITITPRSYGHDHDRILAGWAAILVIGMVLVLVAGAYSTHRFYYWYSLEERVDISRVGNSEYNEEAIEAILEEFSTKAKIADSLLSQNPEEIIQATTTEEGVE